MQFRSAFPELTKRKGRRNSAGHRTLMNFRCVDPLFRKVSRTLAVNLADDCCHDSSGMPSAQNRSVNLRILYSICVQTEELSSSETVVAFPQLFLLKV